VQNAITIALLGILVLAVLKDTQSHRIPNFLTAAGAIAGLLLHALEGGVPAVLMSLAGCAVGVATLLPFYLLRGMGAGDVKLMGAVGTFLGPQVTFLAAAATLVVGAVFALGFLAGRLLGRARLFTQPGTTVGVRKEKFPYAVAIAGGSLVSLNQEGQLRSLANLIFSWSAS
jgi:prepilin peptidase CpaA